MRRFWIQPQRLLVLLDGLGGAIRRGKHHAELQRGLGVVRCRLRIGFEIIDGLLQSADGGDGISHLVNHRRGFRAQGQRFGEHSLRFIKLLFLGGDERQLQPRFERDGPDANCFLGVPARLHQIALARPGDRKIAVGEIVVWIHCEGLFPEREAVAPVAELQRAYQSQPHEQDCGSPQRPRLKLPAARQFRRAPDHHDEHAEDRHVHEAIRHRLHADLSEANRRNERAEEPKPAHQQPRRATHPRQCQRGDRDQQGRTRPHACRRPLTGVQVKNAEVRRPENLSQIARVGHEGVFHTQRKRQPVSFLRHAQ